MHKDNVLILAEKVLRKYDQRKPELRDQTESWRQKAEKRIRNRVNGQVQGFPLTHGDAEVYRKALIRWNPEGSGH